MQSRGRSIDRRWMKRESLESAFLCRWRFVIFVKSNDVFRCISDLAVASSRHLYDPTIDRSIKRSDSWKASLGVSQNPLRVPRSGIDDGWKSTLHGLSKVRETCTRFASISLSERSFSSRNSRETRLALVFARSSRVAVMSMQSDSACCVPAVRSR